MGIDHDAISKWHLSGAPIDYDVMSKWMGFDTEEEVDTTKKNVRKKTKIKTVIREMTPEILAMLDYKVKPVPPSMFEQNPKKALFKRNVNDRILMLQDKIRREYDEVKGYYTYQVEVTDDEEEVEDAAAHGHKEDFFENHKEEYEIVPPLVPLARGRRRYRPGVVKQATGCKKLA
ncbi:uncharacterized protein LOC100828129 [Brachypodium distachyon]|uniref:Uncharacterized protein n=1 Tax=Brachypodium distachyon TaxID=15368 RepID=I1IK77_BRADI|nr:uncharacterized protein LOC100828129 [Brachypodium distachyon]XP_014757581.1 uncharacterized protein LOC100828129 [Brachypodium distachyon]KQJ87721.1 hypothetical protein BRADI_4g13206v3 [Brachypodium distachyon]KQJ87722.1 hypothetical protein BRADI_4g13206v3 [Brachypodium distachyon]KQJ87723.1 hypothetical protein BRADI_4g13206v3 [Brachypodium distachyon]|eukprot:XP_003577333.1 uncharacterized protein LOC100828129 [Brachypodium distachyon]